MFYQGITNFSKNSILNVLCLSVLRGNYISLKDSTHRLSVFNLFGNLKFLIFKVIFSSCCGLDGFYSYFSFWLRHTLNTIVFSFRIFSFVFFRSWNRLFFFRYLKPIFFVIYYRLFYLSHTGYFRVLITSSKRNTFCCIYDSFGKMKKLFTVGQDKDFRKSKKRIWLAHSRLADRVYFCIRKFSLDHRFYFFIKLKSLRSQNKVVFKKLLKNLSYYWKSINKRNKYIHI